MKSRKLFSMASFFAAFLSFALVLSLSSCDSSKSLIADYRAFVESVELAADNGDTELLDSFPAKFDEFEVRRSELSSAGRMTKEAAAEFDRLSGRYTAAVTRLSINKSADSFVNFLDGLFGN